MNFKPLITLLGCLAATATWAQDNQLTKEEKSAGWQLLFNGTDHTGWICNTGKEIATGVEEGALVPFKSGGYIIMHEKKFGDFKLACDVKMSEQCNSGVFFRVSDPKNPVRSGFEVQVMNGNGTGFHDFGAIYDLCKPSKNMSKGNGQWDHLEITCQGPQISVTVNGEQVAEINCDDFAEKGQRPDGTKHKFGIIKNLPRTGYLGFQDHGHKVWFKNVKLLELK